MVRIPFLSSSAPHTLRRVSSAYRDVVSARLTHIFAKDAHLPFCEREREKSILSSAKIKRGCCQVVFEITAIFGFDVQFSSVGGWVGEKEECAATRQELIFHHLSYSCNRSRYIDRRWDSRRKLKNVNKIYLVAIVPIS